MRWAVASREMAGPDCDHIRQPKNGRPRGRPTELREKLLLIDLKEHLRAAVELDVLTGRGDHGTLG